MGSPTLNAPSPVTSAPPGGLEEETPERLLGMRTTAFRTRAATALGRELARTPLAPCNVLLDPSVPLSDPSSVAAVPLRALVDRVTERLTLELKNDLVPLLDHLVEAEVISSLMAARDSASS